MSKTNLIMVKKSTMSKTSIKSNILANYIMVEKLCSVMDMID